jgi:drug/metabolite transporter (DMT)-like permease
MIEESLFFQIVGYVLFFSTLGSLFFIAYKKGNDIYTAIKGENGELDSPEVVIIVWLILFPCVVLGDVFFDYKLDPIAWASMDLVLLGILGYKGYKEK